MNQISYLCAFSLTLLITSSQAEIVTQFSDLIPNSTSRNKEDIPYLSLTYSDLNKSAPKLTVSQLDNTYEVIGSFSDTSNLASKSFTSDIFGFRNFDAEVLEEAEDKIAYLNTIEMVFLNENRNGFGVDTTGSNSVITAGETLLIRFDLSGLDPIKQQTIQVESFDTLMVSSEEPENINVQLLRGNTIAYSNIRNATINNQTIHLNLTVQHEDILLISGDETSSYRINRLAYDITAKNKGAYVDIPETKHFAGILSIICLALASTRRRFTYCKR